MRQDKEYVNQFGKPFAASLDLQIHVLNVSGLSRQAIFNSVNASLQRLGTDYIDLFQIHRFDPNTPIEETMEALHDLVRSGKIRYIGASSMRTYQFAMMQFCAEKHGWTKFVSMQNQYSLIYREEEREMNRFCNETGVGLIPVRFVLIQHSWDQKLTAVFTVEPA
jgi:aryl-alcohol dehydrogenase-like predicted oxidoreductase